MMKKLIAMMLAVLILLSMAACGNKPANQDTTPTNVVDNNEQNNEDNKQDETEPEEQTVPAAEGAVWKVDTYDIYLNYPEELNGLKDGGVLMVMEDTQAMVALTYSLEGSLVNDLEAAISENVNWIIYKAYYYSEGSIADSEIEVMSTEKCTVNGFEGLKFNGVIDSNGEYDCHAYGYVFSIQGITVAVCSLVTAESQDPALIAEFDALADQIASTIRTEK